MSGSSTFRRHGSISKSPLFHKPMTSPRCNKGMTLAEIVIAVGIFAAIAIVLGLFQRDVFVLNSSIRDSLDAQLEARALLRRFTAEVREASPSDLGSFALAETGTSSFAFYTDADDDGVRERVRYFLSGTDLRKGIVVPSGNSFNPVKG